MIPGLDHVPAREPDAQAEPLAACAQAPHLAGEVAQPRLPEARVGRKLRGDPRLTVVCGDGDDFLRSLRGQRFDFVFADTWLGKYRLLEETLDLIGPAGIYAIDDMLPQTNWPEGHAAKAADLVAKLEKREDFRVTKLSWASGMVLAVRR